MPMMGRRRMNNQQSDGWHAELLQVMNVDDIVNGYRQYRLF